MRHGRAQGQHAHQPTQCRCGFAAHALHQHLHAQRVDAGQAHAHDKAQAPEHPVIGHTPGDGGVRQRPQRAAHHKNARGLKAVGCTAEGKGQRACNETQLRGGQQPAKRSCAQLPGLHQAVGHPAGAEPQRGAQALRQNNDGHRQRGAGARGQTLSCLRVQGLAPGRRSGHRHAPGPPRRATDLAGSCFLAPRSRRGARSGFPPRPGWWRG